MTDFSGLPDQPEEAGGDLLSGLPDTNASALRQQYRNTTTPPDGVVKILDLTKKSGLPRVTVEKNMPIAEQRASEPDWDALETTAPVTAQTLATNSKMFEIAHDDTENLGSTEKVLGGLSRQVKGLAGSLSAGVFNDPNAAVWSWAEDAARLTGADGVGNYFKQMRQFQEAQATGAQGDYGTKGFVESSAASGVRSLGAMLPGLLASVMTGNPQYSLGMGSMQAGGQAVAKGLDAGASPLKALAYGAEDATAEYATEMIPVGLLLKDLKLGAPLYKLLAHQIASEVPTEIAATAWQNFNEWANVNPEQSFSDYLTKLGPDEALTVGSTIVQTVLTAGLAHGTNKIVQNLANQQTRAQGATMSAESLGQLAQLAAGSKLRGRDVQTFQEFIDRANEEGDVQDIFINKNTLAQSGIDLNTLAQLSPIVAEQLAEQNHGGDIVIPVSEYAAKIAGGEFDSALAPHLRTSEDALSSFEAQTFYQNQAEEFKKASEQIVEERAADDAWMTSAKAVETQLFDQLQQTGRFTDDVNKVNSTLMRDFYVTTAGRLNLTPEEMFAKYPLQISGESKAGGKTMEYGQPDTEAFKNWFGDSKVVDAGGQPLVVYHGTGKKFTKFSFKNAGQKIIWFTSDKEAIQAGEVGAAGNGVIMDLYAAIKNPAGWAEYDKLTLDELQARGYDGVILPEKDGTFSGFAFDGKQLKSATKNVGTFDPNDPNILRQNALDPSQFFQNVDEYGGDHRPPGPQDGAPLHDLTGGGDIYPDDVYGPNAARYYGHGEDALDRQTVNIAQSFKGRPRAGVRIYRAVPKVTTNAEKLALLEKQMAKHMARGVVPDGEVKEGWYNRAYAERERMRALPEEPKSKAVNINPGDWVTINKEYAKDHGESALNGEYKIISKVVKAREVFTNGDSIHEWGYWPDNTLKQAQGKNRGEITLADDITQQPTFLSLLKNADLSTFLHEMGHFQLEVLSHIASQPNAPVEIVEDLNKILRWFGEDMTFEKWQAMSLEEKRPFHEQFARGFEAYLFEGKAPSVELNSVFARLRSWLINVYKSVVNLRVEINDDIRGVFDRLLATDEAIKQAESMRSYGALFTSAEQMGVDAEGWAEYQRTGQEATDSAVDDLQRKSMRDMQWLTNARNRTLKKLQQDAKVKRSLVQDEVTAEVQAMPVYAAQRFIRGTGTNDITKLSLVDIKARYGEAPTAPWRYLPRGLTAAEGLNPDHVAERFGYTSGDHMIREIVAAQPEASMIEGMTDQRVLERYGDISSPATLDRAADEAIHNAARARFVATELRALDKAQTPVRVIAQAAKAFAEATIARKKVREIKPYQNTLAEARAAKAAQKAMMTGDTRAAAVEKRNQLVQNLSARAAYDALTEIEKAVKHFNKLQKSGPQGNMRGEALTQLNTLLGRFDLRTSLSLKKIDESKTSLASWVQEEADRLSAAVPDLPAFILDETYRKHFKDMTVEEFRGLTDSVKQLEHLARREQKQYIAIRDQNFDQERGAILDILRANYPDSFDSEGDAKGLAPDFVPSIGKFLKGKSDAFIGEFISAENVLDLLERGKFGQVSESLFGRMSHASDWKAERLGQVFKSMEPLLKAYSVPERMLFARQGLYVPEIQNSITRENAVMVALLYGNAEGRERLLNYGWGPRQVEAILKHLETKDVDLVEGIWHLFDHSLWPEVKDLNERTRGKAPGKVLPVPFAINGREVAGGYMRLKYDTELDERAHKFNAEEALKEIRGGMGMSAKTAQGSSMERKDKVALRPRLDLGVFSETVSETVHDLAYREAAADTMRLLNDKGIQNAIKTAMGVPAYRSLIEKVGTVATRPSNPSGFLEKSLTWARKNSVTVLMSGVKTALQNFTGVGPALAFHPAYVMQELRKFYSLGMTDRFQFCMDNSAYMRHRIESFDRDLHNGVSRLTVNGKLMPDTGAFLWLMSQIDRGVSIPVWNAYFRAGMDQFKNDEAKAIDYADKIVRQTQGSGRDVDLAKIMDGHGAWGALKKVFSMFHSYFNGQLGLLVSVGAVAKHEAKTNPALASAKFAAQFIAIVAVPVILTEFLMRGVSDDDLDPEYFLKRWSKAFLMYGAAMFPLVRDLAGFAASTYAPDAKFNSSLKLSPIETTGEYMVKMPGAVYDIASGDATKGDVRNAIMGISFIAGLPGKLINDTVLGTNAFLEGEVGPQAIVLGPPRK